jgi:hypothetical protein
MRKLNNNQMGNQLTSSDREVTSDEIITEIKRSFVVPTTLLPNSETNATDADTMTNSETIQSEIVSTLVVVNTHSAIRANQIVI